MDARLSDPGTDKRGTHSSCVQLSPVQLNAFTIIPKKGLTTILQDIPGVTWKGTAIPDDLSLRPFLHRWPAVSAFNVCFTGANDGLEPRFCRVPHCFSAAKGPSQPRASLSRHLLHGPTAQQGTGQQVRQCVAESHGCNTPVIGLVSAVSCVAWACEAALLHGTGAARGQPHYQRQPCGTRRELSHLIRMASRFVCLINGRQNNVEASLPNSSSSLASHDILTSSQQLSASQDGRIRQLISRRHHV